MLAIKSRPRWINTMISLTLGHMQILITLLVRPFCLIAGGNLWHVKVRLLTIFKGHLATPWQVLRSIVPFVLPRSAFFLGSADFPNCPPRQCVSFILITFSCELSLYTNYHPKRKWQSRKPKYVPSLLKILFGFQVLGFLRRCKKLQECHRVPFKKS